MDHSFDLDLKYVPRGLSFSLRLPLLPPPPSPAHTSRHPCPLAPNNFIALHAATSNPSSSYKEIRDIPADASHDAALTCTSQHRRRRCRRHRRRLLLLLNRSPAATARLSGAVRLGSGDGAEEARTCSRFQSLSLRLMRR